MLTSICARLAGALILWLPPFLARQQGPAMITRTKPLWPQALRAPCGRDLEAFELVGILKDGKLTIYLDRAKDTSPITNATIDLTVAVRRSAPRGPGWHLRVQITGSRRAWQITRSSCPSSTKAKAISSSAS